MDRQDTNNAESISKLLDDILKDADKLIRVFPKDVDRFDIISISLFLTMIDITTDINHLIKINRFLSIPSLVRNFMDAFIDLLLVTSDSKNIYPLLYKTSQEDQRVLKAKINPLHSSIFSMDNMEIDTINKQIIVKENDLNELKKLVGSNKLKTIKDKYDRVNLLWFYETIYSDLCSQTHNGLNSIESRHIYPKTEDKILIKYLQAYDTRDYYMYILILLNHFHLSIGVINKALDLNCNSLIDEVQNKLRPFM